MSADTTKPGWFEFIHPTKATTHIAHVGESGAVYLPETDVTAEDFALASASGRFWPLVRAEAARPVHYRDAADSLDALGHHDAATALRRGADEYDEGEPK